MSATLGNWSDLEVAPALPEPVLTIEPWSALNVASSRITRFLVTESGLVPLVTTIVT